MKAAVPEEEKEKSINPLFKIPIEVFTDLLKDDKLKVDKEFIVVQAIGEYLKCREAIKPLLDEENPSNAENIVAVLTEEEKKSREEAKAKKIEEEKKASDEEKKKEGEAVAALDDQGKIQYASDKAQTEAIKLIEDKLAMKRLTKVQKFDLFKTIRFSHLHH